MFGRKKRIIKKLKETNVSLLKDLESINSKLEDKENKISELNNKIKFKDSQVFEVEENNVKLCKIIDNLKNDLKVGRGRNGGLVKYNHRLLEKIKKLEQENESKPKVKILPPDRSKSAQKTRLKNQVKNYQVKEILKSKNQD